MGSIFIEGEGTGEESKNLAWKYTRVFGELELVQ
jgi:hypothetical protein